jgi:hypothetical protein
MKRPKLLDAPRWDDPASMEQNHKAAEVTLLRLPGKLRDQIEAARLTLPGQPGRGEKFSTILMEMHRHGIELEKLAECFFAWSGESHKGLDWHRDEASKAIEAVKAGASDSAQPFIETAAERDFDRDEKGRPYKNLPNLELALAKLGVKLRFNAFTHRHLISTEENSSERPLGDAEVRYLYKAIPSRFGLQFGKDFLFDMTLATAEENKFHPVRDYLAGLMWDDVPRIDRWLTAYLGVEESEYSNEVGLRWMLGAVERIRNPGCEFHEMLILEGGQGVGKSSALAALAVRKQWFTDTVPMASGDRMFMEAIAGKWIVECSELAGMKRSEVETVKALLSRSVDSARMAFGRMPEDRPRQCLIVGSTNEVHYLRDQTGNRRFWPVQVGSIDLDKLRADVDQLWAEAAHRQAAGESCRMRPEIYALARAEQEARSVGDPIQEKLEERLGQFENATISMGNIRKLLGIEDSKATQDQNSRMGRAMVKLGWTRKRARLGSAVSLSYAYTIGDGSNLLEVNDPSAGSEPSVYLAVPEV